MNAIIKALLNITFYKNQGINYLLLKRKKVHYTSFPRISGILFITGHGTLDLGKGVQINSARRANPIGGDTKTILDLGLKGTLRIGDGTGLSNTTIIAHHSVEIGSNVKIGGSVKIYDTDFHSLDPKLRANKNTDVANTKAVLIKDNAFIGAHSIILKGTTVGKNAIIGAGSVVTKSIPDNQIWAGNPAKYIKDVH